MTLEQLQTALQNAKDAVDTLLSKNKDMGFGKHALAVSYLRSLLPRHEDHLTIGEGVRGLLDRLDEQSAPTPEVADRNDRAWAAFERDRLCYYSKR
jgi:hypothetical protein